MRYKIEDIRYSVLYLTFGNKEGDPVSQDSILKAKSMTFAKRIVKLYQSLAKDCRELLAMLAASIKSCSIT